MRLPLVGGSYSARSVIANAQRCVNYYPERNTQGALVPITHYQRPGLRPLVQGVAAPVRGLYKASDNTSYAVIGQTFYQIQGSAGNPDWKLVELGSLKANLSTPVSMIDNRTSLVLGDGTSAVYTLALGTSGAKLVSYVDPNGLLAGFDKIDYIDTFLIWNFPGGKSNLFGSTLSNVLTTDPLYEAGKTDWNDNLATLIVNRHVILLVGQQTTEIWYDAGNAGFPFAELPGAFFEHGTVAKYSVASQDISVYWLGEDKQGQGVVFKATGYECKRVSNHALEYQLRQMAASGASLSDAIGYTYQFDGHVFYVLTFPTGNQTWQFDEASQEWSQLAWTDSNGGLNRHRGNCFAYMFGTSVVGDWQNGTLYAVDPNVYTDTLVPGGVPGPVTYIRTFPHIGQGEMNLGASGLNRPVESDGREMQFNSFIADIECGLGPLEASGAPASVLLRFSADRGRTYGNALLQTIGKPGSYRTRPKWQQLGIGQDVVFEIEHSIAGPAALQGAWIQAVVLNQ